MKRKTAILVSLIAVLLLAGLCACKQGPTTENPVLNPGVSGVTIPETEKSEDGLQNLPDAVTSGTGTGVSEALVKGLNNPPEFNSAKNVIVMVCEGLTSELIDKSTAKYGELILNGFPVKGTTSSRFSDSEGTTLSDYVINELFKFKTGIVSWGETSSNSLRRMTTADANTVSRETVSYNQFMLNPPLVYIMGKGDFTNAFAADSLNYMYKAGGYAVSTLNDAIPLYQNDEVEFSAPGHQTYYGAVEKLYTIFENDSTLPSFRQEMAFSLAWMQDKATFNGFCLLSVYSPSSALDENAVQDFDEGVAIAVKFVLENPDTVLLICGCPTDGSEKPVCFYGLGKGVSTQDSLFKCLSSLYE